MANPNHPISKNAPGRYYLDTTCVHCDLCHEIAPEHFAQDDHERFVRRQPVITSEDELCRAAMENCPVGAIGNDGGSRAKH